MRNQITLFVFACTLVLACEQKKKTNAVTSTNSTTPAIDSGRYYLDELNKLQEQTVVQRFTVPANQKKIVVASNGLKVRVDPQKLQTVSGKAVDGEIKLFIIEATKSKDFILNDIPTISNGQLLVSGGSYYISMTAGNEALRIKEGETMLIDIPRKSKNDMELFYGERKQNGEFNWVPAGTKIPMNASKNLSSAMEVYKTVSTKIRAASYEFSFDGFLRRYADSVMRSRLDSICLNHKTVSREMEMKIMYAPIIARYKETGGRYIPECGLDDQKDIYKTVMIKPDYRLLTAGATKKIDSVDYTVSNTITENVSNMARVNEGDIDYYDPVEIRTMGWINCDRFYGNGEQLPITLNFDQRERIRACKVYYIFKDINSCLSQSFSSNTILNSKQSLSLPQGRKIIVKIMAVVNGKLVTVEKEITISGKTTVEVSFSKET